MRKILIILFLSLLLTGCSVEGSYTPQENPHLYWKTIDVEVTAVERSNSLNGRNHRIYITVKSEEYGLEETIEEYGSGMFANIPHWNVEIGDIIQAELYSWKIDSTGEIIKREINSLK